MTRAQRTELQGYAAYWEAWQRQEPAPLEEAARMFWNAGQYDRSAICHEAADEVRVAQYRISAF